MVKVQIDLEEYDEEDFQYYEGEEPKRGVYAGKLVSFNEHSENYGGTIRWVFEITEEPYRGWRGYLYTNLDPNSTYNRTLQIIAAVTGKNDGKVRVDTDKPELLMKKAKPIRLFTRQEEYEGEKRGKVVRVMAGGKAAPKPIPVEEENNDDLWDGYEEEDES